MDDGAGAAPFDKGYECKPVAGTEDWSLQVGPDVANKITINYQAAPRQTPLIDVDGVPTEVSGPYRDLPQLTTVKPGGNFHCKTSIVGPDGITLNQREWILQVNRKKHGGVIHSVLAGFEYPCGVDANCQPKFCKEPLVLKAGPPSDPDAAQVHHIARAKDLRGCFWGSNANKNAAVISRKLNIYLTNNYPSADEVTRFNAVPAYTP